MVCLYLQAYVAVLSPVTVLFRSHMFASQHPIQSSVCLPLLRCLAVALLHNVQLWSGAVRCGVVGDICSSPPAKSPHHMVLFMRSLFQYPSNLKKRGTETHKLCPNDNRGNTITGNTFTTNPALSPQWLALHANQDGRMRQLNAPSYQQLQQSLGILVASSSPAFSSHSPYRTCHVAICKLEPVITDLGSTSTFRSLVQRWKQSHVRGSKSGKSLTVSWLAKILVCGLVIRAGPRHALADLGP